MREKLAMWFQQWIQIFTRAPSLQQHSGRFVTGLQKHGIIDNLDTSSMFFRVCTETSVNAYLSFMAAGEYKHVYQALDAMARLVIFILKFNSIPGAPDDENNKLKSNYLERVLSVVVLVLANMHEESGMGFQQRPFSRFFSSLFNDLHTFNAEGSFRSAYPSLLRTLG
jgi:CCR4-NOT transcription complex subunit 1